MKNFHKHILVLFIAFCVSGCYDNYNVEETLESETEEPQVIFETTIVGFVVDQNNEQLDEYVLEINGETEDYSSRYFKRQLPGAIKSNQHIDIIHEGENQGFANLPLVGYDVNHLNLKTFPPRQIGSWLASGPSQEFEISEDLRLLVDPVRIQNAGTAEVEFSFHTMEEQELLCQMGLNAKDENNTSLILNGIIAFGWELTNQAVSFETGSAKLKYSVSNNSENIALFKYDDEHNFWEWISGLTNLDGEVVIDGTGYFQIATYESGTLAEGKIALNGKGVAFQEFEIENELGKSLELRTTANGKWISWLPADKNLQTNVVHPCSTDIPALNINSENESYDLQIDETYESLFFNSTLEVVACDGEILNYPSIVIQEDGEERILTFDEEAKEVLFPICDDSFSVAALNSNNSEAGVTIPWNNDIEDDLGRLSECESFDDGFTWIRIADEVLSEESFVATIIGDDVYISNDDLSIQFKFKGSGTGDRASEEVSLFINDSTFGSTGFFIDCLETELGCGIERFYVSHFEESTDGLIRISFSGTIWVQRISTLQAANLEIEGQFILKNQ